MRALHPVIGDPGRILCQYCGFTANADTMQPSYQKRGDKALLDGTIVVAEEVRKGKEGSRPQIGRDAESKRASMDVGSIIGRPGYTTGRRRL